MEQVGDFIEIGNLKSGPLLFNPGLLKKAIGEAERCFPKETGGILLGQIRAVDGAPILTKCSLAPPDSMSGRFVFRRGIIGIESLLQEEFEKGLSYIGEWHSHPGGGQEPSSTDIFTMTKVRTKHDFPLRTPVLLIVSGSPGNWRASFTNHHRLCIFKRYGTVDVNEATSHFDL